MMRLSPLSNEKPRRQDKAEARVNSYMLVLGNARVPAATLVVAEMRTQSHNRATVAKLPRMPAPWGLCCDGLCAQSEGLA